MSAAGERLEKWLDAMGEAVCAGCRDGVPVSHEANQGMWHSYFGKQERCRKPHLRAAMVEALEGVMDAALQETPTARAVSTERIRALLAELKEKP